jgi:hypothetical protein
MTPWEDAPDPPLGVNSMAPSYWLPDKLTPDFATYAARQSVRVKVENGIVQQSIGFDKGGTFHPVRHFHAGSAYERYRRGMPPGYMGHIPHDATPVTGGKIGVIEKKHPVLYSTVRPATGSHVRAGNDAPNAPWLRTRPCARRRALLACLGAVSGGRHHGRRARPKLDRRDELTPAPSSHAPACAAARRPPRPLSPEWTRGVWFESLRVWASRSAPGRPVVWGTHFLYLDSVR